MLSFFQQLRGVSNSHMGVYILSSVYCQHVDLQENTSAGSMSV